MKFNGTELKLAAGELALKNKHEINVPSFSRKCFVPILVVNGTILILTLGF